MASTTSQILSRHPRYFVFTLLAVLFFLLLAFNHQTIQPVIAHIIQQQPVVEFDRRPGIEFEMAEAETQYQLDILTRDAVMEDTLAIYATNGFSGQPWTLWDFFRPSPKMCRHSISRIGHWIDGGKWVCGLERLELKKSCIIYSMGVSYDSSFEAALLNRMPNCQVYAYDYSVRSMGRPIQGNKTLEPQCHFSPYKLSNVDKHDSNPPEYTLAELMKGNGHTWIDILKVDIEGSEFKVMEGLIDAFPASSATLPNKFTMKSNRGHLGGLPFGQLLMEIHPVKDVAPDYISPKSFNKWWSRLEKAGLRPFFNEINYPAAVWIKKPQVNEISFINIFGDHELISDKLLTSL